MIPANHVARAELYGKIGFAKGGGFLLARGLQSLMHRDEYIAVVLARSSAFTIVDERGRSSSCTAALIPGDIDYRLTSSTEGLTAFIHLDPFTRGGMLQAADPAGITPMERSRFSEVMQGIDDWMAAQDGAGAHAERVLELLLSALLERELQLQPLDRRVLSCIEFIKEAEIEEMTLSKAANVASLSASRLSHLFRRQTGRTFRNYVLHRKLVRSLRSIHARDNLTTASHHGGFSDQPHFTNAFKNAFGIKPSFVKE